MLTFSAPVGAGGVRNREGGRKAPMHRAEQALQAVCWPGVPLSCAAAASAEAAATPLA